MSGTQYTSTPVEQLTPYANNPRTHSKKQIRQISESIREFGWTNPVLICLTSAPMGQI